MSALGLVETKGLLAAIEGADAMLKAADVRLLEKSLASGGLVTITIAGEVSAVAASVSAAVAAIGRIPGSVLVSHHVIARPDAELENIIRLRPNADTASEPCGCARAGVTAQAEKAAPKAAPAPAVKTEAAPDKAESELKAQQTMAVQAKTQPEVKPAAPKAGMSSAAKAQPKAAPKAKSKSSGKKSSKKK